LYRGSQLEYSPKNAKFGAREARGNVAGVAGTQEFQRISQDFFGKKRSVREARRGFSNDYISQNNNFVSQS